MADLHNLDAPSSSDQLAIMRVIVQRMNQAEDPIAFCIANQLILERVAELEAESAQLPPANQSGGGAVGRELLGELPKRLIDALAPAHKAFQKQKDYPQFHPCLYSSLIPLRLFSLASNSLEHMNSSTISSSAR